MEERKFTTADKEYRSAWAKTLMGVKLDETEERALGDAIGTTATAVGLSIIFPPVSNLP